MKIVKLSVITLCILLLSSICCFSQQTNNSKPQTYQNIEVEKFTVKEKVEYEAEKLDNLMSEIIYALKNTKKFQNVMLLAEKPVNTSTDPVLKISGEIIQYDKGNRAARYLIGFGAGKTKVKAKLKFTDSASGKLLLEKDIDGSVWIGLFGGDSEGAKSDLAKDIANLVKKQFGGKK